MAEHRGSHDTGLGGRDKAVDAVAGMTGTMKAALDAASEPAFITSARRGDLYAIEAARIARKRARSPDVRQLAQRMIEDHTNRSNQLLAALRNSPGSELEAELPADLDVHRRTMIDHLNEASDDKFDTLYLSQQKMAHDETRTLFEGFAAAGDNPQLVSFARSTLPVLHEHKALMNRIEGRGRVRS